jgi:hypothetical protein
LRRLLHSYRCLHRCISRSGHRYFYVLYTVWFHVREMLSGRSSSLKQNKKTGRRFLDAYNYQPSRNYWLLLSFCSLFFCQSVICFKIGLSTKNENESVRYRYEYITYFSNKVFNLKYYLDNHSSMSYYTNAEVII